MGQDIEIIVINARGVEEVDRGVGVLRDVFSLFWKETYDSLFIEKMSVYHVLGMTTKEKNGLLLVEFW